MSHELDEGPNFRNAALRAFELPDAAMSAELKVVMPWANQILPAARRAHTIDTASVVSVGLPPKRAGNTDSDAS